jgi:hypothetical protein
MFENATTIIVIRDNDRTPYDSWQAAVPNIEVGDVIRAYMPTGTTKCAEAIPRDNATEGPSWKAVIRSC